MQDSHLLFDSRVSPAPVKMEVLDGHKSAHSTIQLLILHILHHVGLEVGVVESCDLDLGAKSDKDVGVRES